jgi:hypothetical protein
MSRRSSTPIESAIVTGALPLSSASSVASSPVKGTPKLSARRLISIRPSSSRPSWPRWRTRPHSQICSCWKCRECNPSRDQPNPGPGTRPSLRTAISRHAVGHQPALARAPSPSSQTRSPTLLPPTRRGYDERARWARLNSYDYTSSPCGFHTRRDPCVSWPCVMR